MPANANPMFCRVADVQVGGAVLGPTANTAQDGTGSGTTLIFQADATNGSWVEDVSLKPVGSPAATVVRIFLCTATGAYTAGTTNTAANTSMIREYTLASVTSSQTVAQSDVSIPIMRRLAPGQKLLIAFGTSTGSAGTGYAVTTWGGDF